MGLILHSFDLVFSFKLEEVAFVLFHMDKQKRFSFSQVGVGGGFDIAR